MTTIWNTVEKAIGISRKLLDKGIIVRNLSNFGLPYCVRISIGLPEEKIKKSGSTIELLNEQVTVNKD